MGSWNFQGAGGACQELPARPAAVAGSLSAALPPTREITQISA
ncbi:hypothetical protein [Kamptonema formosum]|nr:hypothetical protein [Oscillatoria sp. PCC 10802]